jgi:small conductance mechanosensitive channel
MDVRVDEIVSIALTVLERIVSVAIVLLAGFVLALLLRGLARRLLGRPKIANALGPSMVRVISSAIYYLIIALAIGLSLISLGVPASFVVAAGAIIVIILALALQQSIANLAATVIFLVFQPFKRGDLVETMGHIGTVHEILLFNTVLLTADERLVSLPNSKIQESGVVNYSWIGRVRADFTLTVGYGEDVDHVRAVMAEVAAADERVLSDPPFEVIVEELGDHGVRLHAYPAVAPQHFWLVRNDLREQVKARFDAEGIEFALPQLDLHLAAATGDRNDGNDRLRPDSVQSQPGQAVRTLRHE